MVESYKNPLNRRRGISTIVGGLIFVVLLTAGFSTFFVAMDVQSDTINAQKTISDSILDKTQEQFSIGVATDDSVSWPTLGIQVKNEGSTPVQISNIWIINKSLPDQPAKSIPINYSDAFIPAGYGISILENQFLQMKDPTLTPGFPDLYDIKVVSALGTIQETEISVGGSNYLLAEMFAIPPDVRHNENATIALRITNVGPTLITGINPDPLLADDAAFPHAWISGTPQLVSPSVIPVDLEPAESVIFSWHATLNNVGTFNDKIKFSSSATGTESATGFIITSNIASDKIIVRDPAGGSGEEEVLKEELFGRPKIFMIFPNAVGDDVDNRAVWGVLVANPTDQPMDVTKVVIIATSPRATSSDKIFVDNCHNKSDENQPITIPPTTNKWTCPESNQLMWSDLSNPVTVAPRSVEPFLVEIGVDNIGSTMPDAANIVIQSVVFTTLGQFGKADYASTMHSKDTAMPNVFLSITDSPATAALNPHIRGVVTGITEGDEVTFNAVLVDMSTDTYGINAGTKLIINIPKDWIYNIGTGIVSSTGFTITSELTYPDGSTQIVGELTSGIDERDEARIIQFKATAPSVVGAKMYVMHILGSGTATGDSVSGVFTVGPIAETVLQVCPTAGCPP